MKIMNKKNFLLLFSKDSNLSFIFIIRFALPIDALILDFLRLHI